MSAGEVGESAEAHLATCEACSEFAVRFERARQAFADHRASHEPDPFFASRVSAQIDGDTELLGWAALKLLPATLALLLTLSAWAWWSTPGPTALAGVVAPTDDPISWAIEEADTE